jgi:hypothetical protein
LQTPVDLSGINGFEQLNSEKEFSPLLVTPNINVELNSFSETYDQLMSLPNNPEFADEFYEDSDKVFIVEGYGIDTIINNMILQLLIINGYLTIEDITRGRITEKVNRETIAAAKYAAIKKLKEIKKAK